MKFDQLLNAHKIYGTSTKDIIHRIGYDKILKNVVIAPWWSYTIFEDHCKEIIQVGEKVYNVYGDNFEFSFLELKNIGASTILESVLPLGLTKCKQIVFIGSAGAIVDNIKIGDLAVPEYSFSGVGASRFLSINLEDDFENKYYPSKSLTNNLLAIIQNDFSDYNCHHVANYSVDTIFAQFPHIEHFITLGAKTIEMETSSLFKCCNMIGVESCAIFCISDNTLKNKSLFSGRTAEEKVLRHRIRNEVIPQIIIKLFTNTNQT